jgi:hypothetical protein
MAEQRKTIHNTREGVLLEAELNRRAFYSQKRVPISERALVQRINRKLAAQGEVLKKTRGGAIQELGDYYVLDLHRNLLLNKDVDPVELAKVLRVLRRFERIVLAEGTA